MRVCALCCKNFVPGDGVLFKIPKDPALKADWETVCGKQLLASSLICSDHFPSNTIANIGKKKSVLLPNAKPILKLKPADNLKGKRGLLLHEVEFSKKRVAQTHIAKVQEKKDEMVPINDFGFSNCQSHKEVQTVDTKIENEYKRKIRELERENKDLKLELEKAQLALTSLKKIFTENQIRQLLSPGQINWSWEDISSSVCLYAAGPRAYNHLYKKGFPLPCVSTLQRWCPKINIKEAILNSSIEFTRQTTDLAFDEMKTSEVFEYEPTSDVVTPPKKYVDILAGNTEHLNGKGNMQDDDTEWLNNTTDLDVAYDAAENEVMHLIEDQPEELSQDELQEAENDDIGILQEDDLEYVAQYILKKHNLEEFEYH